MIVVINNNTYHKLPCGDLVGAICPKGYKLDPRIPNRYYKEQRTVKKEKSGCNNCRGL